MSRSPSGGGGSLPPLLPLPLVRCTNHRPAGPDPRLLLGRAARRRHGEQGAELPPLSSSSSSFLRSSNASWRGRETSGLSCTSPTPRCTSRLGSGATGERRGKVLGRSWPCGSGSVRTAGRPPGLSVFCSRDMVRHAWPHHSCGAIPLRAPSRRSAVRAEASNAAIAPCDAGHSPRRCQRVQPWPTAKVPLKCDLDKSPC